MKETSHQISSEDYHEHVYPQVVTGDITIQHGFEYDLVFPNPEKYMFHVKPPILSQPLAKVLHGQPKLNGRT